MLAYYQHVTQLRIVQRFTFTITANTPHRPTRPRFVPVLLLEVCAHSLLPVNYQ